MTTTQRNTHPPPPPDTISACGHSRLPRVLDFQPRVNPDIYVYIYVYVYMHISMYIYMCIYIYRSCTAACSLPNAPLLVALLRVHGEGDGVVSHTQPHESCHMSHVTCVTSYASRHMSSCDTRTALNVLNAITIVSSSPAHPTLFF